MKMNGKRTLISLAVGFISLVCAAFGVDFTAALSSFGLAPDQVVDAAASQAPGWLNLVMAAIAIVFAAFFRVIATKSLIERKPSLDPTVPKDYAGFVRLALLPWLLAISAALVLAGCPGFAPPMVKPATPETPAQSLASAWITHGWANKSITDLRQAKLISADTFASWAGDLDRAEASLNTAQALLDEFNPAGAKTMVERALSILTVLQPLIQEKLDESERNRSSAACQRTFEGRCGVPDPLAQFERGRLEAARAYF